MTLAFIYANYETRIVDDEGIEMDDRYGFAPSLKHPLFCLLGGSCCNRYTTGPISNQLLVGFHKL